MEKSRHGEEEDPLKVLGLAKAREALSQEEKKAGALQVVLSSSVREIFDRYDSDRSGTISRRELGPLLLELGKR